MSSGKATTILPCTASSHAHQARTGQGSASDQGT